jgi:hypothetical protein
MVKEVGSAAPFYVLLAIVGKLLGYLILYITYVPAFLVCIHRPTCAETVDTFQEPTKGHFSSSIQAVTSPRYVVGIRWDIHLLNKEGPMVSQIAQLRRLWFY